MLVMWHFSARVPGRGGGGVGDTQVLYLSDRERVKFFFGFKIK